MTERGIRLGGEKGRGGEATCCYFSDKQIRWAISCVIEFSDGERSEFAG